LLHGPMYEHAFAVQFLGEVLARIDDREKKDLVRKALQRGVKLILDSQNEQGGWRYHPRPLEADISVTCCQVYALMAARKAGITVPQETVSKAIGYIKSCQDPKSGGFRYQPGPRPPGFTRAAAAVAALQLAGAPQDEAMSKALDFMLAQRSGP